MFDARQSRPHRTALPGGLPVADVTLIELDHPVAFKPDQTFWSGHPPQLLFHIEERLTVSPFTNYDVLALLRHKNLD